MEEVEKLLAKRRCTRCEDYNAKDDYCISLRKWWEGRGPIRYKQCPNYYSDMPPTKQGEAINNYIHQYQENETS